MTILNPVVNNLKITQAKIAEQNLLNENYGIKFCIKDTSKLFNSNKLEIIFLENLEYLDLKQNQINKIKVQNYKGLLKKKLYQKDFENIELETPVIVNHNTIINNTIIDNVNDEWETNEF